MRRTDQAIQQDLSTWRQKCVEWMSHPSSMSTPHQSDDEEGFQYYDESVNKAVQGLLGMAAIQTSYDADFGQVAVAEM